MRSLLCAMSVAAILVVAGLAARRAGAADDEPTPTIKKIMGTLHKGAKAPLTAVKTALKTDSPDWPQVQKEAKQIAKYGAFLPKNEPPRGEKASYEKLAKAYASNAKSLEHAADKEDLTQARDASKKLQGSCMACHNSHRPN